MVHFFCCNPFQLFPLVQLDFFIIFIFYMLITSPVSLVGECRAFFFLGVFSTNKFCIVDKIKIFLVPGTHSMPVLPVQHFFHNEVYGSFKQQGRQDASLFMRFSLEPFAEFLHCSDCANVDITRLL